MKKTLLTCIVISQFAATFFAQLANNQQEQKRKIQVAILLDTSGSMNGLIKQAQSRIWNIVNTLTMFQYNGETPTFELALYEYGNARLQKSNNYVECLIPFTSDLDAVSEKLFSLRTSGGEEYCGSVIKDALKNLNWSKSDQDMKLIYISGNEPFNQGSDDYRKVLKDAISQDVIVNTIYCGPYEQGVRELWYDGSTLSHGKYFNIDYNSSIRFIATPYDDSITALNNKLNETYIAFGKSGVEKKEKQMQQDNLAGSVAQENLVERTVAKSSPAYINDSWDLVDYTLMNPNALNAMADKELPKELQGKTEEEKAAYLELKRTERANLQVEIAVLADKRQKFINDAKNSSEQQDDFGAAILESLIEIGTKKNYTRLKSEG
jgi:hypothetical protein